MLPTVEQLQFLNGLLKVLANDYRAEVDQVNLPQGVIVTLQRPGSDDRLDSGFTIDPSDEDDGKWSVSAVVTVYGNRECPDDIDLVEVEPPSPWEQACAALVRAIVQQHIQAAFDALADAQYAKDLEDSEVWLDQDFDPNDMPF